MTEYVVGIDMGSTSIKMLVATPEGREVLVVSRRSPWINLDHGRAEISRALEREFDVESSEAAADLKAFLDELMSIGAVREQPR